MPPAYLSFFILWDGGEGLVSRLGVWIDFLLFYLFTFYLMVMVGTKWVESVLVEILFSCCCRWFFPMTSPAVQELVRKVTMAEHTATTRYLMNDFM